MHKSYVYNLVTFQKNMEIAFSRKGKLQTAHRLLDLNPMNYRGSRIRIINVHFFSYSIANNEIKQRPSFSLHFPVLASLLGDRE